MVTFLVQGLTARKVQKPWGLSASRPWAGALLPSPPHPHLTLALASPRHMWGRVQGGHGGCGPQQFTKWSKRGKVAVICCPSPPASQVLLRFQVVLALGYLGLSGDAQGHLEVSFGPRF